MAGATPRPRPTSGGSSTTPDGFHTAADLNADVSLSFTAETIATLSGPLTVRVATFINGSVRSDTYTNPITT